MGLWSTKWLVLWSLWAGRLVPQPTLVVQLSNGPVRGTISPDGSHAQYTGIPYATVVERFKSPGPHPIWEDVFEAVNEHEHCFQSVKDTWMTGTKDCLILNVYSPLNITPDSKLPVMVYFHGGGFFKGSGSSLYYGPKYLVSKGVILVTLNYRVNIQGFLCLRIKEAPGNAGMKDQVAALRWIKRNIRALGGDPDNVTIFGESAGAVSVSYHLYSSMSKGLFHKAITQSGSSLATWVYQYRPVFLASLLAKVMLFESQDPYDLYKYFMTKSDDELILTRVPRKDGNVLPSEVLYTPCAEKVIEGEESFLTESPFDILTRGDYNKVPVIIGSNSEEGLLPISMDNDTMLSRIKIEKSLPKNLEIISENDRLEVIEKLNKLYMEGEEIFLEPTTPSINMSVKLSRWLGEVYLNYPSLEETELLLKTNDNPIYNYMFSYSGNRNMPKLLMSSSLRTVKGATHADDVFYIFSQDIIPTTLFENNMIESMTTMWTNFAKYGDPTPDFTNPQVKWHRANSTTPTALVIDSEFHTAPLWYNDRVKYLREVYFKFRRKEKYDF